MTIVVMMAAKNTKPPKTPNAIMPPENFDNEVLEMHYSKKFLDYFILPRLSCCCLDLLSFCTAITGTSALGPSLA